jgi:hypothetical protein
MVGCQKDKVGSKEQNHDHSNGQSEKIEKPQKKTLSPHTETMLMIGDAHIHIDYSSPGVRGRIIFGGLVGYDDVWQAGAHNATWIETNKDLMIDGKLLPKGKYGFFTIPSKNEWTVIFNKNWDQHGKDEYDEKEDVIRYKAIPIVSEESTEHLLYKISKTNESEGVISMAWERITINIPFKLN